MAGLRAPGRSRSCWASLFLAWLVLQLAGSAQSRNAGIASQVFAVFQKNGAELIVNLGDHDDFEKLSVPRSRFPAPFFGTLLGADVAVVGSFDENLTVPVGGSPLPRANVLFSTADAHPEVLDDLEIEVAFSLITGGTTGFLDTLRSVPVGGSTVRQASAANSFRRLVGNNAGGAFPFSTADRIGLTGLLLPVFGAAESVHPELGGPPREIGVVLPLRFSTSGGIDRLVPSELKRVPSQMIAAFTKHGVEVVVNLGDHDDLALEPVRIDAAGLARLGGSVVGASLSVVGVFDEEHSVRLGRFQIPRPNIMYSQPGGPSPLSDAQIARAFGLLAFGRVGFLDTLPALRVGGSAVLPRVNSLATRFGTNARGAFPFSIATPPIGPGGIRVPISGAAAGVLPRSPGGLPHELEQIQEMTVTPDGLVSVVHTI